jgi:hypothetical protein
MFGGFCEFDGGVRLIAQSATAPSAHSAVSPGHARKRVNPESSDTAEKLDSGSPRNARRPE